MSASDFRLLPFADAVAQLDLAGHFGEYMFDQYGEGNRQVRVYDDNAVIEGNIDLDALFWAGIAGIFAKRDLQVKGDVLNWEIDTTAAFLAVGRDLSCRHLIAGSSDIRVRRDLKAEGIAVSSYNHGYMDVSRDLHAKVVVVEDHNTIVGGRVHAVGFREPNCGESEIKESVWEKEILPEVRDEFLLPNGFRKCPNGNVDLVKALMAGRKILLGQLD